MLGLKFFLILLVIVQQCQCSVVVCKFVLEQEWDTGFLAKVVIPIAERHNYGWILYMKFEIPVRELDVFEAQLVDGHPNNKEYVFSHKDYNYVIYHYKDKLMNLYLQGNQYPTHDRSVYIPPPVAEVLFIPHLTATESIHDALKRAENMPKQTSEPSVTTTTTATSTTTIPPTTTTLPPTTRLPWFGWKTDPINILTTPTVSSTLPPTTRSTPPPITKNFRHNLREVIKKSLLFFEAQRSGNLPITNRISWRSHSALRDGSDNGVDLTGGYYTGGGHVKYGFPLASAISLLSWGAIEFKRGYVAAKELGNVLVAIKWGADYLLKCHTSVHSFYGQVSNQDVDNAVWGRPEDMQGARPSYKITRNRPGSDLAAETAAAFAAASITLKRTNPKYSEELANHSIALFRFADRYRGKYDDSITEAKSKYGSTGYFDELAWAAAWLYGITTDTEYLHIAKRRLAQAGTSPPINSLTWNDKRIAVISLLAQMTNRTEYRVKLLDFCDSSLPGTRANYTHKGLLFLSKKDTTSLASNTAFICLFAANVGLRPDVYRAFAQKQLNYILGDSGSSFVVGYGKASPKRPYHKASSCPKATQRCSWLDREADAANPNELVGALVSGPDIWDNYVDDRNLESNKVSVYNNAGFQTLAAGILQIQVSSETFSDPEPGELMPAILPRFDKHHDYGQVLRYSNMFYEAQRSGRLPPSSRITWRKSACVNDKSSEKHDLSGGFFDGGDYIKFNFPMAFTTTVLAWSLIMYPQSYESAGEKIAIQSLLRWSTDYFVKCHTEKYELYGQVGSSAIEHSHWLRPEDINYIRPAFKISKRFPGSELAAETAAAMAATATALRSENVKYADLLIKHAEELYEFADKYRDSYHRSIPDAAQFYPSFNGYKDELVWASIWLHLATNKTAYLKEAKSKYRQFRFNRFPPKDFDWDDKTAAINVLLAKLTGDTLYLNESRKFCDHMLYEGKYTPKGLLYRRSWSPLQFASGASLICLISAELGIRPEQYREFAKNQIHYILGDSGVGSYVVGYGPSPPKRPHHRVSSCPLGPTPCNFTALYSKEKNPQILHGAVVGGPDHKDQFVDDRSNARSNKVCLTFNAAFQATVAGLRYLQMFPPPTSAPKTTIRTTRRPRTRKVKIKLSTTAPTTIAPTTVSLLNRTENTSYAVNFSTIATTYEVNRTATYTIATTNQTSGATTSGILATAASNTNVSSTNVVTNTPPGKTTIFMSEGVNETATTENYHSPVYGGNSSATLQETHSTAATTIAPFVTSSQTAPQNTTTERPDYCGRQRALQLFDSCAIPGDEFYDHTDSKVYRCRFRAFTACVGVQTDNCIDGVWEYFPYWNHNAGDKVFFNTEDQNCKDQTTLDIENCELRGLSQIFDECFEGLENWNTTKNSAGDCRCVNFGTCVSKRLSHCKRTWKIWKLWNIGLPVDQQFTDSEMECNSAGNNKYSTFPLVFFPVLISRVLLW
ncbi:uncharacterized protein LOC120336210 [Styela clava]